MPVKVTMNFRLTTIRPDEFVSLNVVAVGATSTNHVAKWTESHFCNVDTVGGAKAIVESGADPAGGIGLLDKRAAILPKEAVITHYTLQRFVTTPGLGENSAGATTPVQKGKVGDPNFTCDDPRQGLLCEVGVLGGQPQNIRFILRGVPDARIVGGEFEDGLNYKRAVTAYLASLARSYGTYVDDRTGAAGIGGRILEIDVNGNVTGMGPIDFLTPGGYAKVVHTTNSDGRRTGGVYVVGTPTVPGINAKLLDWDRGATTGGRIFRWQRVFAAYDGTQAFLVGQSTRKVGSPKDYRGTNRFARS